MSFKNVLLVTTLLLTGLLAAQVDSLGQWRSLQSYAKGSYVTESETDIIYTTGNTIFYLDKADLSITPLTRTDGLAGGRIDLLRYHPPTGTLIIVYENSTLDLLRNGRFFTLRQIDNFNFSGDKRIYNIAFGENNRIYLAAGYGVSALSLDDNTFLFTTFTGVRVEAVAEYDGRAYAATEEGLYRVPLQGTNINDFNAWQLLGFAEGLPGDYSSASATVWKGRLYFGVDKDIWTLAGNENPSIFFNSDVASPVLRYLSAGPTTLLAGYRCTRNDCSDRAVVSFDEAGNATRLPNCAYLTNNAIEDDRGRIWFGDDVETILYLDAPNRNCQRLVYPGPPKDNSYRLLHDGSSLWVAPGQLDENAGPLFDFNGVYRFKDGSWMTYSTANTAAFLGRDGVRGGNDDVATVIDVGYNPITDTHYFSSFFEGLIGLDGEDEATLYDETNSSIELSPDAGLGRIRVAGTATDAEGFTYAAISRAASQGIVSVRSPEGQWVAIGQSCDLNIAVDIAVDQAGYVWVLHRGSLNGGITVIDPMGTPMDPSDDRCRTITASNSNLPTSEMRSITVDLDGSVWVGTALGIVTFRCGERVFEPGECLGNRPVVSANDGFGGLLLETVEVRAIAVDGGNRKWIGTTGGAFLLSENGDAQLLFFDRGNSPLLDNTINDIAIDPNTGTVYFGTELGVISFRSNATAGGESFAEALKVFPNPVEPGYDGPISIGGLSRNARVKITDLSGKLVEEGTALGGQFTWDGRDYNGRRVTTGVYMIYASAAASGNFDASSRDSAVGKIVFVR